MEHGGGCATSKAPEQVPGHIYRLMFAWLLSHPLFTRMQPPRLLLLNQESLLDLDGFFYVRPLK